MPYTWESVDALEGFTKVRDRCHISDKFHGVAHMTPLVKMSLKSQKLILSQRPQQEVIVDFCHFSDYS